MTRVLFDSYFPQTDQELRSDGWLRSVVTTLAVERFRLRHDRLPESLADLIHHAPAADGDEARDFQMGKGPGHDRQIRRNHPGPESGPGRRVGRSRHRRQGASGGMSA